jgi:hypothetical protein
VHIDSTFRGSYCRPRPEDRPRLEQAGHKPPTLLFVTLERWQIWRDGKVLPQVNCARVWPDSRQI